MGACPIEAGGFWGGGQGGSEPFSGCPVSGWVLVGGAGAMGGCPVEAGGFGGGGQGGIDPLAG